jgi:hypothetical protein
VLFEDSKPLLCDGLVRWSYLGNRDTALVGRPSGIGQESVLAPYHKDICGPIRELIRKKEGIELVEQVVGQCWLCSAGRRPLLEQVNCAPASQNHNALFD